MRSEIEAKAVISPQSKGHIVGAVIRGFTGGLYYNEFPAPQGNRGKGRGFMSFIVIQQRKGCQVNRTIAGNIELNPVIAATSISGNNFIDDQARMTYVKKY